VNLTVVTGRLVADPVVREIGEDNKVAEFRVAVDRRWAKEGQQSADFIQVKVYGAGRADFVVQYFQKGKPIEVVGSLHIDTVKNNDDTYTSYTYIRADEVNFVLSDRKDGNSDAGNGKIPSPGRHHPAEIPPELCENPWVRVVEGRN